MRPISYPLMFEQQSQEVANLQEALCFLIEREAIALPIRERQRLLDALAREQSQCRYGETTGRIVSLFQTAHGLQPGSEVDQATGETLNQVLERLGAFPPPTQERQCVVSGFVRRENGRPLQGSPVRALHEEGRNILTLGESITDSEGHYVISYEIPPGIATIHLALIVLNPDGTCLFESKLIQEAKTSETVDLVLPNVGSSTGKPEEETIRPISPPLKLNDSGPEVANLQRALPLLIASKGVRISEREHLRLTEALTNELDGSRYGEATARILALFQEQHDLQPTGDVDEATAEALNSLLQPAEGIVRGTVSGASGLPLPGIPVKAFARSLRGEVLLGSDITDRAGSYLIRYIRPTESRSPDLIVRAFDPDAQTPEKILAESPLIIDASTELTVDLTLSDETYRAPSEFERLSEQLRPLLDGIEPGELDAEQVAYLATRARLDPLLVAHVVRSSRLAQQTGIPTEIFYGLFRQDLPIELPALLAQHREVRSNALKAAAEANLIPARFGRDEQVKDVSRLQEQATVELVLAQPAGLGRTPLSDLLATVIEDSALQQAFVRTGIGHSGTVDQFWQKLSDDPQLHDRIPDLQFTLQLGALTGSHLPLVRELQGMKRGGEIRELRDLARWNAQRWEEIVSRNGIGVPSGMSGDDGPEIKAKRFSTAIAHMLEDAFPTEFIAARIAEDGDFADRDLLERFFENNREFQINGARLTTYLAERKDAESGVDPLDRIVGNDTGRKQQIQNRITGLQRLHRLAPRYEQMRALLQDGLDSAHIITRMGPTVFQAKYAEALGGRAEAVRVFERAEQVAATALTLIADYGLPQSKVSLHMLPDKFVSEDASIPDLRALFGPLDLCDCPDCRSVYSPAAYLVDILHFLEGRQLVDTVTYMEEPEPGGSMLKVLDKVTYKSSSALDVLLDRRSDLQEIELTCENTNIAVPYVDLVNEVLEEAVAPLPAFTPFSMAAHLEDDLDEGRVPLSVQGTLKYYGHQLSANVQVTLRERGLHWTLTDPPNRYDVNRRNDQILISWAGELRPLKLSAHLEEAFDQRAVTPALRFAFAAAGHQLSEYAEMVVNKRGEWWTIEDLPCSYVMRLDKSDRIKVELRGRQTSGTAEERAANPQYINPEAYKILARQVAPLGHYNRLYLEAIPTSLPFNLWIEEIRAYLRHLGVERHELMEALLPGERAEILEKSDIAHEYLGLSPEETLIVNGKVTGQPGGIDPGVWNLWGFVKQTLDEDSAIPDPACSTKWITATTDISSDHNWLNILTERADVFLQQSGLKYVELLALLGCHTINPLANGDRKINVVSRKKDDPDTSDLDKLRLRGFDEEAAANGISFIRLWRKLGWTMRDLDRVILGLSLSEERESHITPARFDDTLLVRLSHVARLHNSLKVPIDRLASWWATNLANDGHLREWWTLSYIDHDKPDQPRLPSLYERLFRNKAVINPIDPAFTEDPVDLSGALSDPDHMQTITAALGISAADLTLLFNDAAVIPRSATDATKPDDVLKLSHLAELHRHATLAKALRLSIRDYLSLLKLMVIEPFESTTTTVRFVEQVERLRTSGFTIDELDYLLRHKFTDAVGIAPAKQAMAVVLNDIRAGLQAIAADSTFVDDPSDPRGLTIDANGELTRKKLALLNWDSVLIDEAVAMLNDTAVYEVDLATLPQGVTLPNDTGTYETALSTPPSGDQILEALKDVVYYDTNSQKLKAVRPLTPSEQEELLKAAGAILGAVQSLLKQPNELYGKISYDKDAKKLRFIGSMTDTRLATLKEVSPDADYQEALDKLYQAPRTFTGLNMRVFGVPAQDFSVEVPKSLAGVTFPDAVADKVYYDAATRKLHFVGVMTDHEKAVLLGLSDYQTTINGLYACSAITQDQQNLLLNLANDSDYQKAIKALYTNSMITQAQQKLLLGLSNDKDYKKAVESLYTSGGITKDQGSFLLALSNDAEYQKAIEDLYDAPRNAKPLSDKESITSSDIVALFEKRTEPRDRFALVLVKLLPYLRRALSERLVKQKLGEALSLEAEIVHELLTQRLSALGSPGEKGIGDFLEPAFAGSNPKTLPSSVDFPYQFAGYMRLHKIALVVARCKLTPGQMAWLFRYGSEAKWLDLCQLPLDARKIEDPELKESFAAWERLVDLVRLRDILPAGETLLTEIFTILGSQESKLDDLIRVVCAKTKWDEADAVDLVGKDGFNCTFPTSYKDGQALLRLAAAFVILKRLGMSARKSQALATIQQTQLVLDDHQHLLTDDKMIEENAAKLRSAARSVVQAARAKYDEKRWLEIVKPLRDVLREKQRAALVAYVVTHPGSLQTGGSTGPAWRDVNDFFAHFLIDVEMSPCQLTSRIKQAIGAVQLFVQRSLMNLEPEVKTGAAFDIRWREWSWMKNYRVWEANRKVFLYPENWIEPELRDDKSPFFKELESELLQNDLKQTPDETDIQLKPRDPVETAFMHYLEKLDAVARLEIVGEYHQQEWDMSGNLVVDQLHVFGRTSPGIPHIYYYRRWVDSSYWTAWEKVDVDIEGDHLIPVVWNRRLYLFWPIFTKKQEEKELGMPQPDKKVEKGAEFWEIQMAWSEYQGGRWSAKRIASAKIKSDYTFPSSDLDPDQGKCHHFFRAEVEDNELHIWYSLKGSHNPKNVKSEHDSFFFTECNGVVQVRKVSVPGVALPESTLAYYMFYQGVSGGRQNYPLHALCLPKVDSEWADTPALDVTPGRGDFYILCPHQDGKLTGRRPFFFQDDTRSFFVNRETEKIPIYGKLELAAISPETIGTLLPKYLEEPKVVPGPRPPIPELEETLMRTGDPLAFVSSFPVETVENPARTPATISPKVASKGIMNQLDLVQSEIRSFSDTTALIDLVLNPTSEQREFIGWLFEPGYRFRMFYHSYVCNFVRHLNRDGVAGLLQRQLQLMNHRFFDNEMIGYAPTDLVLKGDKTLDGSYSKYPREDVDFSYEGAYSLYNWELFFHAPLLIADRLSQNQCFAVAQKWFHYIFDPTDRSDYEGRKRYWQTRPFFETTDDDYADQNIRNLLRFLAKGGDKEERKNLALDLLIKLDALEKQVGAWRKKPFRPHLIARLRTTAYQKTVVMKYLDNLIAWGDQLFRRDTIEAINEATQLYILAAEILGARPEKIPPRAIPEVQTYRTIAPQLDAFSNALVAIEDFIPPSAAPEPLPTEVQPRITLPMLYFCVPKNDKLLSYWDTVADRLFKVRHCMNIEGVVRQLPLFEPPIDPALLVKAVAAGIDISSALNDINAALPYYRFNVIAQKAGELCAEVKALGAALLAALEKRDAEELALLRSTHEIVVLEAVRLVKEQQVNEAKTTLEGLKKSREVVEERCLFYRDIEYLNVEETLALFMEGGALLIEVGVPILMLLASALGLLPDVKIGSPTTAGATTGGGNSGGSTESSALSLDFLVKSLRSGAALTNEFGKYARRWDEWKLQERLARRELDHIDKQIAAAEIRQVIAEQELKNHDLQIENAQKVDEVMHDKFTNYELYNWTVGQISSIYFQSYQLAYDVAKRAERAFRHELGLKDSSFIQFGYWDSLKKGLLAGERLSHDLKRMEIAYLDQNRREYEMTKHISLRQLDPVALIKLKQNGECYVSLPEALFDLDCSGHYMRRIKSVSLTIPCVTGPYTGINCTLTLLKSSVRHSPTLLGGDYTRDLENEDPRFVDNLGVVQSVVTSSSQSDSGLFETNLRDERYLPFEGSGAISEWRIELPSAFRQFEYDTISDVILHLRYTAREGGNILKGEAIKSLEAKIGDAETAGQVRLFSVRHEFPSEWARFKSAKVDLNANPKVLAELTLDIKPEFYPFWSQSRLGMVKSLDLFARINKDVSVYNQSDGSGEPDILSIPLGKLRWGGLRNNKPSSPTGPFTLYFSDNSIEDLFLAFTWEGK